ncbi:hypothetical protein QQF64_029718 [Cirrhinus molitorella]|uniref:Uncharacterized protein n=1 Tax=Cirrhinus molitorella TaxID=172907 RepID=A0ABR3N1J6_9TELE
MKVCPRPCNFSHYQSLAVSDDDVMRTLHSALRVIHLGIHHNCVTHLLVRQPFLSPSCLNIHLSHLLPIRKLEGGKDSGIADAPTIHIKMEGVCRAPPRLHAVFS